MTAKPYPAYFPSGTTWLGEVPTTWNVGPLGVHFRERKETVSDTEFPPLSVTMAGIVPQLETAAKTDNGDNRKRVEPNDFVINSRSDRKGSSGVSPLRGSVSVISIVLESRDLDPRFVHHLLRSEPFQEEFYRFGSGIVADLWSTRYSMMKQITLAVPPRADQRQIADYLDAQTAKIDALIEKQEKLIETLAERRQALISHAVTKGLDPNVPMKDSGMQWIGKVPEQWSLKRISWLFRTVGSGTTPPSDSELYYGEGLSWVTTGELREGTITETAKSVTELALSSFTTLRVYEPGTLLIAMYGATIGRLAVLSIPACTNQACCAMAEPVGVLTRFAFYALLAAREQILVLAVGGGQPNINQEVLRSLRLPTPPMSEQRAIIAHLDHETSKIDALSDKAREMIDVLKERRQALISAAVTGKIDVRGLT